ncbi:MAG TPA: type II toxin-antitoxin system RelE/ParE family toxin, partial [Chroococcales cyanobacterium]
MSRIRLTVDARQDLKDIYDFIADDNVASAHKQIRRLQERWRVLVEQPRIGRKRGEIHADLRSLTEGKYVIFYRIIADGIQII